MGKLENFIEKVVKGIISKKNSYYRSEQILCSFCSQRNYINTPEPTSKVFEKKYIRAALRNKT